MRRVEHCISGANQNARRKNMEQVRNWAIAYAEAKHCIPLQSEITAMAMAHAITPIVVYAIALTALAECGK
jgi:hypothetical protein